MTVCLVLALAAALQSWYLTHADFMQECASDSTVMRWSIAMPMHACLCTESQLLASVTAHAALIHSCALRLL